MNKPCRKSSRFDPNLFTNNYSRKFAAAKPKTDFQNTMSKTAAGTASLTEAPELRDETDRPDHLPFYTRNLSFGRK
jgi:hypothetical protein